MSRKKKLKNAYPRLPKLKGFTLIEVLIAMSLLSIMVVLLFGSIRICAQSLEQGENKMTKVNEVAAVYNFFQRHLSIAQPFITVSTGAREKEQKTLSFQGKKHDLQFVSIFPTSAGRSGLQLFSIQHDEAVLKVTVIPFFQTVTGEHWQQQQVVLLGQVSDFSLAYFGIVGDAHSGSWQDEWLDKDNPPRLVKINIATTTGSYWPEMIIELKVTSPKMLVKPEESSNGG